MRTIYRDCVVGLVVSQDNKVLMGMKDPRSGGVYANCWHLPGGGIEGSEKQIDALKRELSEEVNLDISKSSIKLVDDEGTGTSEKRLKGSDEIVLCKMKFFVYKISVPKKAIHIRVQAGDDIQKLTWFDLSKLRDIKLTPPSQEFFSTKMNLVLEKT